MAFCGDAGKLTRGIRLFSAPKKKVLEKSRGILYNTYCITADAGSLIRYRLRKSIGPAQY